jgi:DNA mismatch endonuclease (patch repair protein)
MPDILTKEQRRKAMQHVRSKNTSIEVILRKALWNRGIRYRTNYKELPGKPDIVITKYKIAVFCDSEFFHGKNWDELHDQLKRGNNAQYWISKIERNRNRDIQVEKQLSELGWTVMRFWGEDIKKHTDDCVKEIESMIIEVKIQSICD